MKTLTLIFILFSSVMMAQSYVGIYFGYSDAHQKYADWVEIPDDGDRTINGVNAGLVLFKPLAQRLELESKLGLARRGAGCFPGFTGIGPEPEPFNGDTQWLIDYAENSYKVSYKMPLLKEKLSLNLGAGAGVSYAIQATERVLNFDTNESTDSELFIGKVNTVNRLDYGLYSSARINYQLTNLQLFIAGESYVGFRDVDKVNTSKNRALSLNFGVSKTL